MAGDEGRGGRDRDAHDHRGGCPAPDGGRRAPRATTAFLLAQVGAHAAERFAALVGEVGLSPALAGVLRLVARDPGRSQQALAGELDVVPSKMVALVDDLEHRGLVQRRRNPDDRRVHALHLTPDGQSVLARVRRVAEAHNAELTAALTRPERRQLTDLLTRLAEQQGLLPGVHPGFRRPDDRTRPASGRP